jgi:lipoprotein signal peptidase
VLDFIHVWVRFGDRPWAWPDFNVADSAITTGAILLILIEIFSSGETDAPDPD